MNPDRPTEPLHSVCLDFDGTLMVYDEPGPRFHHEGIDMSVPRLTPILAAADGVVTHVGQDRCCTVRIRHDDGWRSHYVHLNNDTAGTDDGLGTGIAPWVVPGARVLAGQVIGWVGDSTNAEDTVPHLHFELRMPDDTATPPQVHKNSGTRWTAARTTTA